VKANVKVVSANNESQLIRLLQSKRVDAIYSFRTPIMYIIKKEKINNNLRFQELRSSSYYSCFNRKLKDHEKIVEEFNLGLKKIRKNGTYKKIIQKYVGK
jgi:ABC-type amino acid transport substrate-binding protein